MKKKKISHIFNTVRIFFFNPKEKAYARCLSTVIFIVLFTFQPITGGTPWFKTFVSVGILGALFDIIRENRKKRDAIENAKLMKKRNFIILSVVYMTSALCLVLYTVFERLYPEQTFYYGFLPFGIIGFLISAWVLIESVFRKEKG